MSLSQWLFLQISADDPRVLLKTANLSHHLTLAIHGAVPEIHPFESTNRNSSYLVLAD